MSQYLASLYAVICEAFQRQVQYTYLRQTDQADFIILVLQEAAEFVDGGKQRRSVWQEASSQINVTSKTTLRSGKSDLKPHK